MSDGIIDIDGKPGFLFATELSDNIVETKEGYLLCLNVPIARVGTLTYSASEVGNKVPTNNGVVIITRGADELFSDECIASFNGKPTTLNHPEANGKRVLVSVDTWSQYAKGVIQNTRPNVDEGTLVADLLVTHPSAIDAIRSRTMRQISVGYEAELITDSPGFAHQISIRGNHAAIVRNGRCGPQCSITDSEVEMSLIDKFLGSIGIKTDEPEQIKEAIAGLQALLPQDKVVVTDEASKDPMAVIAEKIGELFERIDNLDTRFTEFQNEEWLKEFREKKQKELEEDLGVKEPVQVTDSVLAQHEIIAPGKEFVSKAESLKFADSAILNSVLHGVEFDPKNEGMVNIAFNGVAERTAEVRKAQVRRTAIADSASGNGQQVSLADIWAKHLAGR